MELAGVPHTLQDAVDKCPGLHLQPDHNSHPGNPQSGLSNTGREVDLRTMGRVNMWPLGDRSWVSWEAEPVEPAVCSSGLWVPAETWGSGQSTPGSCAACHECWTAYPLCHPLGTAHFSAIQAHPSSLHVLLTTPHPPASETGPGARNHEFCFLQELLAVSRRTGPSSRGKEGAKAVGKSGSYWTTLFIGRKSCCIQEFTYMEAATRRLSFPGTKPTRVANRCGG